MKLLNNIRENNELSTRAKAMLVNPYTYGHAMITEYWEKAESVDEFKQFIFSEEELKNSPFFAQLSRESNHEFRVYEMFEDSIVVNSDFASVKVGNHDFRLLIPNGGKNGPTKVKIFNKDFNRNMLDFAMNIMVKNPINIYKSEVSEESAATIGIPGMYSIYVWQNYVAIVLD